MRLVVAITGATGAPIGVRLLEALREAGVETHLVISRWGRATLRQETGLTARQAEALAAVSYRPDDLGAAIASGSFRTNGMVVAPCSMKTLAALRTGLGDGLVGRAGDVTLKERRKLVLVAREAPLSAVHLENMLDLTRMGAVVVPPMLAFYDRPQSVAELVEHIVARVLDQFGLDLPGARRWAGMAPHGDVRAPDQQDGEAICGVAQR